MKMQSVALNEICRLAKRNVDPSRQPNRIFAHYSIPAFDDGERPVIEQGQLILSAKTVVPERAVLFSKLNPRIPRVWLVTDELEPSAICSTEFLPLVPDETKCDRRYLAWNLRSPRFTSGLQGGTAAATKSRERVNPEQVLSARIPLPSLSEQRRIADAIDAAMAEAEAASHAAEAQGKFVQKVRAAVFVDLLEQEESEREVAPLLDLCLGNGQYGLSLKASSVPLGLPILNTGGLTGRISCLSA
jgi:type I restriction enzyme S subunit